MQIYQAEFIKKETLRPNWIGLVNLQTVVSQLFIMVLIFLQSEW